jgi:protein-disulfide isomerase
VPSGKKSKQARRTAATRTPPPVQSKGGPRRRQADPRVLALAGGVAALVIIGIVLGVVLSRGGGISLKDVPTVGSLTNALPGAADVESQFKGIPQSGLTLGSPEAPVTLVEYIDLQCPFCQQFETQVLPNILEKYVRTGKVKVEARPLAFIGPADSIRGRKAMLAAAEQNKAFNFAQILYYNQGTENTGWLDDSIIAQGAASIPGLKVHVLLDARSSGAIADQAKVFDEEATADKVTGTPTLYVGKSGKKGKLVPLTSATDQKALVDALDAALSS